MKLLTLNEIADLYTQVELKRDELFEELMEIADAEERAFKANHGLFGRLGHAQLWLGEIERAVEGVDVETPIIKLNTETITALYDAYLLPKD